MTWFRIYTYFSEWLIEFREQFHRQFVDFLRKISLKIEFNHRSRYVDLQSIEHMCADLPSLLISLRHSCVGIFIT